MSDMQEVKEDVKEMREEFKQIKELLTGKDGNNGFISKVNFHEKYISGQIKVGWVVLTTVITSVVLIGVGYVALKIGIPKELIH